LPGRKPELAQQQHSQERSGRHDQPADEQVVQIERSQVPVAQDVPPAAQEDELAAAFGLTIDVVGPAFGNEALLAEIADSAGLATLVGESSRYLWPDSYDLRRVPVQDPVPVYPISLIWRADNRHPGLTRLRHYVAARRQDPSRSDVWLPKWVTQPTRSLRR
jgi:DNA-binding transcriptional LysR family regulator